MTEPVPLGGVATRLCWMESTKERLCRSVPEFQRITCTTRIPVIFVSYPVYSAQSPDSMNESRKSGCTQQSDFDLSYCQFHGLKVQSSDCTTRYRKGPPAALENIANIWQGEIDSMFHATSLLWLDQLCHAPMTIQAEARSFRWTICVHRRCKPASDKENSKSAG